MQAWEYTTVVIRGWRQPGMPPAFQTSWGGAERAGLESSLCHLGEQGWEVIAVTGGDWETLVQFGSNRSDVCAYRAWLKRPLL
jgi:hypothetical protein